MVKLKMYSPSLYEGKLVNVNWKSIQEEGA